MTRVRRAGATTFAAMVVPNYRRYVYGQAVSLTGTWMQMTAMSWLVYHLSGSSTILGLIVALQTLPVLLLGPYGGVVADRVDKRMFTVFLQAMMGLQALALGLLTVTGNIHVWEIGILAAILGLNNAFENPARQSFMLELVGPEHLRNAVSLNSVMVNGARSVGPAVGGLLISGVGVGWCFLLNASSFIFVILSLTTMDTSALRPSKPTVRAKGQLREGLAYVRSTPTLLVPLVMMGVAGCLTYEFQVTLPVMAKALHGGPAVYGFMTAAMGIGAVFGGLFIAARGKTGVRPLMLAAAGLTVTMLLATIAPSIAVELIALAPARGRQPRLHVDRQLDDAAQRRPRDARPRDVAVVRRLPGLDPDRRTDRRRRDGHLRGPGRPRPGDGRDRRGHRRRLPGPAPAVRQGAAPPPDRPPPELRPAGLGAA